MTERTRLLPHLVCARIADPLAATEKGHTKTIHVPVFQADRAPRPKTRRHRRPLRVRLAPRPRGLVFGGDARADFIRVRPRRGAVEHLLRGRRRGRRRLRPRRLRRALVPDLLAGFAMAAVPPVDSLTVRRAVPATGRVGPPPAPSRASAPGAYCVVPQGQLSLAFSPQMVQVKRSRNSLARAFLASYSFTFSTYSCFIPCRGVGVKAARGVGKLGFATLAEQRLNDQEHQKPHQWECVQKKQAI